MIKSHILNVHVSQDAVYLKNFLKRGLKRKSNFWLNILPQHLDWQRPWWRMRSLSTPRPQTFSSATSGATRTRCGCYGNTWRWQASAAGWTWGRWGAGTSCLKRSTPASAGRRWWSAVWLASTPSPPTATERWVDAGYFVMRNVQDKIFFFVVFDAGSHPPLSRHCLEIMLHLGG